MGGNNRQKKSSSPFAVFNIFKGSAKGSGRVEDYSRDDSYVKAYKVWPSDEDRGRWVAEPGIDRKASAYIDKIRTKYVADHERQATPVSHY